MKNLIALVLVFMFGGSAFAGPSELEGTWILSGYSCENGTLPNQKLAAEIMASTSKTELSFVGADEFKSEILQGACSIMSSGSFTADSSQIKMDILDVKATNCQANKGSYSVGYEVLDGNLLIYQPRGYRGDALCGSGVRGVQVFTKK